MHRQFPPFPTSVSRAATFSTRLAKAKLVSCTEITRVRICSCKITSCYCGVLWGWDNSIWQPPWEKKLGLFAFSEETPPLKMKVTNQRRICLPVQCSVTPPNSCAQPQRLHLTRIVINRSILHILDEKYNNNFLDMNYWLQLIIRDFQSQTKG